MSYFFFWPVTRHLPSFCARCVGGQEKGRGSPRRGTVEERGKGSEAVGATLEQIQRYTAVFVSSDCAYGSDDDCALHWFSMLADELAVAAGIRRLRLLFKS